MSIQSLAFTSATSASFGAATTTHDKPRRLSLMASIFDALTVTPAKVHKQCNETDREVQTRRKTIADEDQAPALARVETKVDRQEEPAIDASETHARGNWRELRARVESVDTRVFAYQNDPKYLQQLEKAKQRRALAAASKSPGWH